MRPQGVKNRPHHWRRPRPAGRGQREGAGLLKEPQLLIGRGERRGPARGRGRRGSSAGTERRTEPSRSPGPGSPGWPRQPARQPAEPSARRGGDAVLAARAPGRRPHAFSLGVPFPSPLEADVARGSLAPGAEPRGGRLGRSSRGGSVLAVRWGPQTLASWGLRRRLSRWRAPCGASGRFPPSPLPPRAPPELT